MSETHQDQHTGPTPDQPLAGTVVVELGHSVAAPFAGRILGDMGATVIKVENPKHGDDARQWGPPFWNGVSTAFGGLNSNKLSTAVDLKNETERAALRRLLVERADVVVQNMRPGLVAELGLDARLRAENKRLIYCNLTAFGAVGPFANRPGYDPLMQAFGGIMSITGEDGRPPVRVGPSIVDMSTGMWAVIGILAALYRRTATGEGCEIDTSLFESTLSWIGSGASGYLATGKVPVRRGTEMPFLVPYKVYEAADGYILIAAGNDNLFARLAEAVGHAEWLQDPRFATNPQRVINRDVVNAALQDAVQLQPRKHWIDRLEQARVPCAGLQTVDEVLEHPQTKAVEMLQRTPDGKMAYMGLPISFDGVRPKMRVGPPELGADTNIVFGTELKLDEK
ncbi:MAG TPA: CoA transferase [Beijerinckiaceae bacterium]|nr:CoA transferase [Beijerinckiaceae bacterium]